MGILDLFVAACIPVLEVLLVTGIGAFLSLDRIKLLGEDARIHLNNIVFYVFTPALVASTLAKTITFESMVKLWFMPVNILIIFLIGSAFGWIVIQLTKAPSHLRGLILGCCAAGNLGNILLIIVPEICEESGSPFGDSDVCYTYGMAYVSLSMAIGAVYLWSYVYNIMRVYSSKSTREVEVNCSTDRLEFAGETPEIVTGSCTEALLPSNDRDHSISEDDALPRTRSQENVKVPISVKLKKYLKTIAEKMNLRSIFAPSTIGVIVGFIVGMVPIIRKSMIGDDAPLRVIQNSATLLGEAAIPAITLILGGNLTKGLKGSGIKASIIIGIIVARYILMPLLGIVVVKGAHHFGFVHSDSLYQFVLLIQFAVPPAMNIGTITQLFGTGESECSVIMLWTNALAAVSLTLWSTFFMWLVA